MNLTSIIETVFAPTSIAWGFLLILVLIFLAMAWAVLAPGFPGIACGLHTVLGYYAGGNLFRMFRGNLVDCTHTWLAPYLVKVFREDIVKHELEAQLKAEVNADVNASYNIMKKAVPKAFADGIEGLSVNPLKISF